MIAADWLRPVAACSCAAAGAGARGGDRCPAIAGHQQDGPDREPEVAGQDAHRQESCSTMARPRPPIEESDGCAARGRVMLPPSLTATSSDRSRSAQATSTRAPGRGLACMIALVSNSLTTTAASPIAGRTTPASCRWVLICQRAVTTLAGACGSSTTLDVLTSCAPAPGRTRVPPGDAPSAHPGNRRPCGTVSPSGNPLGSIAGRVRRSR